MLGWLRQLILFFKQKTAYEMRISDWSSDVCSSDLPFGPRSSPKEDCRCNQGPEPRDGGGPAWTRRRRCMKNSSRRWRRSEEHTSELQSLMRISYAVFCLKKKKQSITNLQMTHTTTPQEHTKKRIQTQLVQPFETQY